MRGLVTKSTGSWYQIQAENGQKYEARIRGKFRLSNIKHTNPIVVGDFVDFELDKDNIAVITNIQKRQNYIIRKSVNLSKKTHIIASNVELAVLLATVNHPRTSTGFIDRFLITAEAYHIPVLIVFNKLDLYTEKDLEIFKALENLYESIGYEVLAVSAKKNKGLENLKEFLKDKTSVFSGHSGVGKSTLVNQLHPDLNLKTKDLSDFNKKGQHTTTFAQLFSWPFGGNIIDTPGIKELGLVDFEKEEIQDYFPEIFERKSDCKFHNCLHTTEPQCAIKNAVELGEIEASRYDSYLTFLEEAKENENDYSKS